MAIGSDAVFRSFRVEPSASAVELYAHPYNLLDRARIAETSARAAVVSCVSARVIKPIRSGGSASRIRTMRMRSSADSAMGLGTQPTNPVRLIISMGCIRRAR